MSTEPGKQVLAEHTDEFNAPADPLEEDATLLNMETKLGGALTPVALAPAFRARLRDGLTMAAQHQPVHEILTAKRADPTWGWVIGAAALGSAAGVIAVVLRSRTQTPKTGVPAQMQN
jgi:hypothetical protein